MREKQRECACEREKKKEKEKEGFIFKKLAHTILEASKSKI